jgi:hypothetical protein
VQQSRRPVQSRSRFSNFFGSRLMIILVAGVVIVVAVFLFRAYSTKSTASSPTHASANTVTKHSGHSGHRSRAQSLKPPTAPTADQLRSRAMNNQRKHYAARIVPVMNRSTHIFDGAARGAALANGNFDTLQQSCSNWGGRVEAIEAEYEGVPHPYVWWTPAGTLHHQVSGVYHYMLGAIQNCQEAVQATDSDASSTAVSQMVTAAQNLHNQENYARFVATH